MAANSALVVSSLDFDTIRSNLVTYMQSQSQFKDYNYLGSNLSQLIDLLAYNTYMNAFYTNMAISESFLDSAQIRDSVVSRAKELNYTPRSRRSDKALVNIQITPTDAPASVSIPKGSSFNTRIDNDIFTFSTDSDIVVTAADNYLASNVAIYEGVYVTEAFTVDNSITNQRFILNNTSIDTSSVTVNVQNSVTDTSNSNYVVATSLLGLTSSSNVFFIQAADKDRYEVIFGDNVTGNKPVNGNLISVTYRVSSGPLAAGATDFQSASSISGYPVSVTTLAVGYGGASAESIESIKFSAPRHYETQERAIIPEDYKTILYSRYPDIRAINVYGGETVNPPRFGEVFISIDLNNFDGLQDSIINDIKSYLTTKMPITVEANVIPADYLYIDVAVDIIYNLNQSSKSSADIATLVASAIKAYNATYLNKFQVTFRYSRMASNIDDSDPSIVSSNITTRMIKKISPVTGVGATFALDYMNPIIENSLVSSQFTYSNTLAYMKDTGSGEIAILTDNNGSTVTLVHKIGSIDYSTGLATVDLPGLQSYIGPAIKVYAEPVKHDFVVTKNTVMVINDEDISTNVTSIRE